MDIYKNTTEMLEKILSINLASIQKEADNGNLKAIARLGRFYLNGSPDVNPNSKLGLNLLKKAASKGIDDAYIDLIIYHTLENKPRKAIEFGQKLYELHKSNHSKNPSMQSEFDLATDEEYGWGVEQNFAKAIKTYKKLHKKGFKLATFVLGLKYRDGIGVRKNSRTALNYIKIATEDNSPYAYRELALMQSGSTAAFKAWEIAASDSLGDEFAIYKYAEHYIFGKAVDRDWNIAEKLLENAKSLGSFDAEYLLNALSDTKKHMIKELGYFDANDNKAMLYLSIFI